MYVFFFHRDLVTSHFINLYLYNNHGISILRIHFAYISCCYVRTNLGQAFRLSGTTFTFDEMVCIKLVNRSIFQMPTRKGV